MQIKPIFFIVLLVFIVGCFENTNTEKNIKEGKNHDYLDVPIFTDSLKLNVDSFVINVPIDSSLHCGFTDKEPLFHWVKKTGRLIKIVDGYLIQTDSLCLYLCNLKYIKLKSDSMVLFSGISFRDVTDARSMGYPTVLESINTKKN